MLLEPSPVSYKDKYEIKNSSIAFTCNLSQSSDRHCLEWSVQYFHSLKPSYIIQFGHNNRQQHHTGSSHHNSRQNNLYSIKFRGKFRSLMSFKLKYTSEIPLTAAKRLLPTMLPFSSATSIPLTISCCRINGILMQLAAATAANGT